MKNLYVLLNFMFLFFCSNTYGQFDYLMPYIPSEKTSTQTHPILEIKTWVHIVQFDPSEPRNITKDSLGYLTKQFQWINQMFEKIQPPTVANSKGEKPYIKDSRIRFIIDTVSFHVDSIGWDRMQFKKEENSNKWLEIIEINPDSNSITIKGIRNRFKPILDSLIVGGTLFNNGIFHPEKITLEIDNSRSTPRKNTVLHLKENIQISEDTTGYVTYFKKIDKNCHKDNWVKLANEDKNYLHVFYTGASKDGPAFGCGPSPYFLNVSNILKNGGYATAQLTGHELGHCVGLRHTNTPQFDDLPRSDRFGWIQCNDKNTSNNIMGYNLCRNYLSPLQIAYIHYRYSNVDELARTTKNIDNTTKKIKVKNNTVWDKSFISTGSIIVKKGNSLEIKNKVIMPNGSKIILEKNSTLTINGGIIKNIGGNWGGIVKCKSYPKIHKNTLLKKNRATIQKLNGGEIVY